MNTRVRGCQSNHIWLESNLTWLDCERKMTTRRLIQFDPDTGEEFDGFVAYVAPKRKHGFGQRWLSMAQDATRVLALSDELNGNDLKVFLFLTSMVDFENQLLVNQAEVARQMGKKYQHINRSIKRLVELGVLLEGQRIGVSRSYRFNPEFGWKGSTKNHVTALKDERERRMKAAGITGVIDGGGKPDLPKPSVQEPEQVSTYNPHCGDFWPELLEATA